MHFDAAVLLTAAPAGSVFALDLQTLAVVGIQLFNACVLAAVLSFLLYKPVRAFMQKRTDRIQSQVASAQSELAEASELRAQYEARLKEADLERMAIMENARMLAAEKGEQIVAAAREEADAIRERARLDVQREFARAQEGLQQHIIDLSSLMAERFIAKSIDESTQDMLYEETLKELEEVSWLH